MYECVMHVYTVCPDERRVEIPKTRDANDPARWFRWFIVKKKYYWMTADLAE
jgi:hypothetical protein